MRSIQAWPGRGSSVGVLLLALGVPAPATQFSQSRPAPPSKVQVEAPEIDPSLAKGLAVLLVGGVLVLTSLRRRRRTPLVVAPQDGGGDGSALQAPVPRGASRF